MAVVAGSSVPMAGSSPVAGSSVADAAAGDFVAGNALATTDLDASTPIEESAGTGASQASSRRVTRLQQGIRRHKVYTDGTVRYGNLAVTAEPANLSEALKNDHWKQAMDYEYSALMRNHTWHLVPSSQSKNIIDCKWVYKVKKGQMGL